MTTPTINSIQIPAEYVALCEEWRGGKRSMMYAIASTGNLTTGARRFRGCETNEEWYLGLWEDLLDEVNTCYLSALDHEPDDADTLGEFETWVEWVVKSLQT